MTRSAAGRGIARGAWWIAGAHLAVLLAVAGRYGYHRDELYFLEAGKHLALGYVDQPPLVPLLARVQTAVLGDGVAAIRVVPALVATGTVLLAALLARELGGGRRAQVLAAGAMAGGSFALTVGHLLSTTTLDLAFWMAIILLTTRMLRTDDPRWWLAIGALAGAAAWNKLLIVLLPIALVVGLAAGRRWGLLTVRWLVAGGLLAALIAAPVVWWQATNGWPQVEMAGSLSARLGGENRATLLPLQVLLIGPVLLPLLIAGVRWLWRDGPGQRFRPLLWAYAAALLLTLVTGGRPYYSVPLAAALVVAGAVALEHRTRRRLEWSVAVNAAIVLPLALPLLPVAALAGSPIGEINDTQVESIGWPQLASQVREVVDSLPPEERSTAVLLTGSYGEAGALDRFGPQVGLPTVYSGHNSYWHWRRPQDDDATVVAIRMSGELLSQHFTACEPAGAIDNGVGADNEAQGQPIWVCRGLRGTWAQRWPQLRHYS